MVPTAVLLKLAGRGTKADGITACWRELYAQTSRRKDTSMPNDPAYSNVF